MPYKDDNKEKQWRREHREQLNAYNRCWYARHRDEYRARARQRSKEKLVRLKSGRRILINNKPPYPLDGGCALCERNIRLIFHHWDDRHPEHGIWVCPSCHEIAEGTDKGLGYKYWELKDVIEHSP